MRLHRWSGADDGRGGGESGEGDDEDRDGADVVEIDRAMAQEAARRQRWLSQLTAFAEARPEVQAQVCVAAAGDTRAARAARFARVSTRGQLADAAERERVAYVQMLSPVYIHAGD